jgi:23S rRNA pseudouridine1911/1915/1917 synthase
MTSPAEDPPRLTVPSEAGGSRLDRFLAEALPQFSRSRLQALIRQGHVLLQGKTARPSEVLRGGETVEIHVPAPVPVEDLIPRERALSILWEDADLVVLDKPAGLVVHPGAGTNEDTLVHALLHHCRDLSGIGGEERPGIVHRLDKETSGCLVVAKNDFAHRSLAGQFAGREVKKVYLAVVKGQPRRPWGTIDAPIARHPVHRQKMAVLPEATTARAAVTRYEVLRAEGGRALVECHPETGRTHQIRVHLKHLGFPILGDPVYGHRDGFDRHWLHAWKLSFRHPRTGRELACVAPVPPDFPLLPDGEKMGD